MRGALWIPVIVASHGIALWLGRTTPAGEAPQANSAPIPSRPAKSSGLAAFLRTATPGDREEVVEEEEDEDALLAAARAAIPTDADVAAMVRAGVVDPDLEVSPEMIAAYGVWVDRDPVAALRWLGEWLPDAESISELAAEVSRHLEEGGVDHLALYLREVPAMREFLLNEAGEILDDKEPGFTLRLSATLDSMQDRLECLTGRFESYYSMSGHLAEIRGLLDDSSASAFLGSIRRMSARHGLLVYELEQSGFPPFAVSRFEADHSATDAGQTRTDADFIGSMEEVGIPGVPEATGTNITDIVTTGSRGAGDGFIIRNNIDAVLNNPNRTAALPLADRIRNDFDSEISMVVLLFDSSELESIPSYAGSREQFMRGKITGEEWIARLQEGVPGSSDLRDEITALAFRACVGEDPRRAVSLLAAELPYQGMIMDLRIMPPEVLLLVANRFSRDGELSQEVMDPLTNRFITWSHEDPEACTAYVANLPAGPLREHLQPFAGEGSR